MGGKGVVIAWKRSFFIISSTLFWHCPVFLFLSFLVPLVFKGGNGHADGGQTVGGRRRAGVDLSIISNHLLYPNRAYVIPAGRGEPVIVTQFMTGSRETSRKYCCL